MNHAHSKISGHSLIYGGPQSHAPALEVYKYSHGVSVLGQELIGSEEDTHLKACAEAHDARGYLPRCFEFRWSLEYS